MADLPHPAECDSPTREQPARPIVIERRRNLPALLLLIVAVGGLLALTVLIISPFLAPLAIALILSFLGYPFYSWILRRVGQKRRGLAALLACAALTLLVILPLAWIGWSVAQQAGEGVQVVAKGAQDLSEYLEKKRWFQRLSESEWFRAYWAQIQASIAALQRVQGGEAPAAGSPPPPAAEPGAAGPVPPPGAAVAGWITRAVAGIVANTLEVTLQFFLMLLILFYFLKDGPEIFRSLQRAVPLDLKYQEKVVESFQDATRSIIRGSFGTALVQGVVASLAFVWVGIPAVFWGAMVGLSSLIPPLGTALVTLPITLSFFLAGHWGSGIYLAVVSVAIGTIDNIVRPLLMGQGLRTHPIWLLLAILGALDFFGPVGLIYGPLVVVLLGTFIGLFVREEREESSRVTVAPAPGSPPPP